MSAQIEAVKTTAYATKGATVSNTAKAVSHADFSWGSADLTNATRAFVTARTGGVMATWSGVTPTATLGHLIPADGTIEVLGNANIQALKFIREASTDAAVTVSLER